MPDQETKHFHSDIFDSSARFMFLAILRDARDNIVGVPLRILAIQGFHLPNSPNTESRKILAHLERFLFPCSISLKATKRLDQHRLWQVCEDGGCDSIPIENLGSKLLKGFEELEDLAKGFLGRKLRDLSYQHPYQDHCQQLQD